MRPSAREMGKRGDISPFGAGLRRNPAREMASRSPRGGSLTLLRAKVDTAGGDGPRPEGPATCLRHGHPLAAPVR